MSAPVPPLAEIVTVSCWQNTSQLVLRLKVDGERVNFALSYEGVGFLMAILPDAVARRDFKRLCDAAGVQPRLMNGQPEMSSGMPSVDGSQVEGQSQ